MPALPHPPTVLITGATSGIGFHTASALAGEGAHVLVTGRDEARGALAAKAIRHAAGHDKVEFFAADHSTIAGNEQLAIRVDTAVAAQGAQLDVLINNVGRVFSTRAETADGLEQTLALCFVGPVALTETLPPTLTTSPQPRVVNVVSSAFKLWRGDPFADMQSHNDYVGLQVHARAKLLNLIWTFALAAELGPQFIVNATNPGAAWTDARSANDSNPRSQPIAPLRGRPSKPSTRSSTDDPPPSPRRPQAGPSERGADKARLRGARAPDPNP